MDHKMTPVDLGTNIDYVRQLCARCACGFLTEVVHNGHDLDDEISAHQRQVVRDRIAGGMPRQNLKTALRHYEKMASHPACTVPERTQWETLAQEARDRIEQTTVDNTIGQDSLLDLLQE